MSVPYLRGAAAREDIDKVIRFVRLHLGDGNETVGKEEIDRSWVEAVKILLREEPVDGRFIAAVALTGGRSFAVDNLNYLPDIAAKIGCELRNQYVLGYHPSQKTHDARWRKIKVKLRPPKGLSPLSAYAKTGYYAPGH
jgi:VWFA-related protein